MQTKFNITPSTHHHICMVDALGRAGRLDEAEDFIASIYKPDVKLYHALLGACRVHNDLQRAERISTLVLKNDPKEASTYVLLSNIYASNGMWDKVLDVREQ